MLRDTPGGLLETDTNLVKSVLEFSPRTFHLIFRFFEVLIDHLYLGQVIVLLAPHAVESAIIESVLVIAVSVTALSVSLKSAISINVVAIFVKSKFIKFITIKTIEVVAVFVEAVFVEAVSVSSETVKPIVAVVESFI